MSTLTTYGHIVNVGVSIRLPAHLFNYSLLTQCSSDA